MFRGHAGKNGSGPCRGGQFIIGHPIDLGAVEGATGNNSNIGADFLGDLGVVAGGNLHCDL